MEALTIMSLSIAEALALLYAKHKGSIVPYDGVELDTAYVFFTVDKNGDPIANNAQFVITKDGELCEYRTLGVPLPKKYMNKNGSYKRLNERDVSKIWKAITK